MGFSLSCFASHQTVAERDLCRVIPILQSATYHLDTVRHQGATQAVHAARNSWSPHVGWEPVGELMQVRAQGYGRMTLELTSHCRRQVLSLLHHLLQYMPVVEAGDTSRDGVLDLAAMLKGESEALFTLLSSREFSPLSVGEEHDAVIGKCWNALWEAFCRHRLYVLDNFGRIRPMEFALMHEDAYQALVARRLLAPRRDGLPVGIAAAIMRAIEKVREVVECGPGVDSDAVVTQLVCASRFSDLMVDLSPGSQKLELLKAHFNELGRAIFTGELAVDDAARLLQDDVKDIYAVAALGELGIGYSPLTYAPDEDYDNHCGRNYVEFVSTVSRMTDRSRKAALFGEFRTYQLLAASEKDLQQVVSVSKNWDCGLELVSAKPVGEGQLSPLRATIDSTLNLEQLQRLLGEVKLPFMRESVKLASI